MTDDEIRAALTEAALTDDEQAHLVADALERAGTARVRPARWPLAAAAVLVVALGCAWYAAHDRGRGPGGEGHEVTHDVVAETIKQRKANRSFLDSAAGKQALSGVEEGRWVVVHDTRLHSGAELEPLLKQTRRGPTYHRYVFRKGEEGDRSYDATFLDAPWAGTRFMAEADFDFDSRKLYAFPTPDGRPWIPVARDLRVVVSTGSVCPLLLPRFSTSSLYEIPGKATVVGGGGTWRDLIRRRLRVRIEKLGIDGYFEAVEIEGLGDRNVAGKTWRYFDNVEAAARRHAGGRKGRGCILLVGAVPGWVEKLLAPSQALLEGLPLCYSPFGAEKGATQLHVVTKKGKARTVLTQDSDPEHVRTWLSSRLED